MGAMKRTAARIIALYDTMIGFCGHTIMTSQWFQFLIISLALSEPTALLRTIIMAEKPQQILTSVRNFLPSVAFLLPYQNILVISSPCSIRVATNKKHNVVYEHGGMLVQSKWLKRQKLADFNEVTLKMANYKKAVESLLSCHFAPGLVKL